MDRTTNSAPGARRQGRRLSRSSGAPEDPTRAFFQRHLKQYVALETHVYAGSTHERGQPRAAEEFRGDTSSDEAFNPLNFGLRRG